MKDDVLTRYQERFNDIYPNYLPKKNDHIGDVYHAIDYSFSAGGKRLRPALIYSLAESLSIDLDKVDALAVAAECIHTYSLIHDDLPDMDNDDLRRGKPSCHVQFDPATAILAGDALNTLAFEILSKDISEVPEIRLKQISVLSAGAGISGMVGGQDTDLNCEQNNQTIDLSALSELHTRKTGRLIEACLLMPYFSSQLVTESKTSLLSKAALSLGLFYQIQDDILDVTQTSEVLGKPADSDIDNNKSTYVSLLGLENARETARKTSYSIHEQLSDFLAPQVDYGTSQLAVVINSIMNRQH